MSLLRLYLMPSLHLCISVSLAPGVLQGRHGPPHVCRRKNGTLALNV
ncbi:hypothetical protein PENANT_c001G10525 [Penicillium antarcticum]|uniref:Uncharacterized protein n=1 Tax=Penicillium antarcticum TaxID=416450 RepID=A0A1V6QMS6_9EURO|nr:hypothetical protein PENANT_c001G10525 [Penicillium antarcticum]